MILTHVCSLWRAIALGTLRLWDNIQFLTSAFARSTHTSITLILDRSRSLSLSVTIETPLPVQDEDGTFVLEYGGNDYDVYWLDTIWDCRLRLASMALDITCEDYTRNILPRRTVSSTHSPVSTNLASLSISVSGDRGPNLAAIFDSFQDAPLLRSLRIQVDTYYSDATAPTGFPWWQLTTLILLIPLVVNVARTILVQCKALEIADLSSLFDWDIGLPTPQAAATLHNLHQLKIAVCTSDGIGIGVLLDALSLPKLASLSLNSTDHPASALLELQPRASHFSLLEDLSLVHEILSPSDLVPVLGVMPALQTLDINKCTCIVESLFELLAGGEADTSAGDALILPQLTTLKIHPITDTLDGDVVVTMAKCLAKSGGEPDAACPRLRSLCLYRRYSYSVNSPGVTFAEDIECRLATVYATGFLVESYPRE